MYLSSFWNTFVWDDEQFIYKNSYVQSFNLERIFSESTTSGAGIQSNYYRPLTTTSFALDHAIWGFAPAGFHLTNLLLHIGAGVLLFLILARLRLTAFTSFVLSLIFLIHPIQTEAVTYINSRGDSLYAFFGFMSIYIFIRLIQSKRTQVSLGGILFPTPKWLLGVLVAVTYLCSILAKEIGITIGGLLFLVFLLVVYQQQTIKRTVLSFVKELKKYRTEMITLFCCAVLALFYLYLRSTSLNFQNSFDFYQDASTYSQSLMVRLLTFTHVFFVYVRLLLVPFPLHMERTIELVTSLRSPWPWLFLMTNVGLLAMAVRKLRQGKPLLLFGFIWFFLALLPVSGIIPINGILYEHWLYVPMVGFFIVMLSLVRSLPAQWQTHIRNKKLLVLVPVFLLYSLLTIRQNFLWSTPIRLYSYLLQHTESGRIYNNLAMAFAENQQSEQALEAYDMALTFGDIYPQIHHNKGNLYRAMGNSAAAEASYQRAIEMDKTLPYSYGALLTLYLEQGKQSEADTLTEQVNEVFGDASWLPTVRSASPSPAAASAPASASGGAAR